MIVIQTRLKQNSIQFPLIITLALEGQNGVFGLVPDLDCALAQEPDDALHEALEVPEVLQAVSKAFNESHVAQAHLLLVGRTLHDLRLQSGKYSRLRAIIADRD